MVVWHRTGERRANHQTPAADSDRGTHRRPEVDRSTLHTHNELGAADPRELPPNSRRYDQATRRIRRRRQFTAFNGLYGSFNRSTAGRVQSSTSTRRRAKCRTFAVTTTI